MVVGLVCLAWPMMARAQFTDDVPIFSGPGFFATSVPRGPFVIIPTLTLAEEYNDNIFLDNTRRRSDFITHASPGLRVAIENPGYGINAGYFFTAEKYAQQTQLDSLFRTQGLFADTRWLVTPLVTLTLGDILTASDSTNAASAQGISTGRTRAVSNTVSPGLAWQLTPRTSFQLLASYTLERFDGVNTRDSDSYRLGGNLNYDLTRRLRGTVGYEAVYLDIQGQAGTTTHTPRAGLTYQISPSLTGSVSGGPTFVTGSDNRVSGSGTASLVQRLEFGSASLTYDRSITVAGGLGGPTENQTVGAAVRVTTLVKGLALEFAPSYTTATSVGSEGIDVRAFRLVLRANYQITPWMGLLTSYNFFHQRTDTTTTAAGLTVNDVDQNRVFLGLQFGFPIKRD
ncbi:MAG: hypothetical protein DMD91_04630 [Candidatus Rokuibacteriota bacterium]|nr:MAG: hypothetical protein DMD91_04630 [Candidatus Rokubacteria bacterium]